MNIETYDLDSRINLLISILVEKYISSRLNGEMALCGIAAIASLKHLKSDLLDRQKKLDTPN